MHNLEAHGCRLVVLMRSVWVSSRMTPSSIRFATLLRGDLFGVFWLPPRRHSSRNFDPLGEIPESFMSYRHCHRGRLCHRHHRRRHSSRNFAPLGEIPGMVI